MKIIKFAAIVISVLIVFASCQKQLDFEAGGISIGSLQSSATGDCSPILVNGVFKVDSILTNDNYVDVKVDVSIQGSFEIKSDTINGYSFSKSGTIGVGMNTIRLYASGKPLAEGVNTFTISYGATICSFSITVFNATVGGAVFTLGGSPGNCSISSTNGVYQAGQAMTAANTVEMTVNVTTVGAYSVTGTVVNGVSFGASGVFINPGVQNIFLAASGTPVLSGPFDFPVTNSATSCDFPITFSGTVPPTGNIDYIPQTSYSNWSRRDVGGGPDDTAYVHVLPTPIVIGANTYKIFETVNSINYPGVPLDSFYFRKNGGLYYYIFKDSYGFDNGFNTEGLLLDSSLVVNANWIINLGNDTWGGLPASGSIKATILAKGASANIAGNNYNNIIKVEYIFRYNIGGGDVDYNRWESWYARGIGNIYSKYNQIPVTSISEEEVYRLQVY